MTNPMMTADERITNGIIAENGDGCWIWRSVGADGYGRLSIKKREVKAHRFVYEHMAGPIPQGLVLDHLCHERDKECAGGKTCPHRACVNPQHLEPVTLGENIRRGRARPVLIVRSGRCVNGHALESEVIGGHGAAAGRRKPCKACARDRHARNMQDPDWRTRRADYERNRYQSIAAARRNGGVAA